MFENVQTYEFLKRFANLVILVSFLYAVFEASDIAIKTFLQAQGNDISKFIQILKEPFTSFLILMIWIKLLSIFSFTFLGNNEFSNALNKYGFLLSVAYLLYNIKGLDTIFQYLSLVQPFVNFFGVILGVTSFIAIMYSLIRYLWSMI
ncbi:MAG: hypothetical protein QW197_03055 [Candidatus Aenigmatarchaeota archaeon]